MAVCDRRVRVERFSFPSSFLLSPDVSSESLRTSFSLAFSSLSLAFSSDTLALTGTEPSSDVGGIEVNMAVSPPSWPYMEKHEIFCWPSSVPSQTSPSLVGLSTYGNAGFVVGLESSAHGTAAFGGIIILRGGTLGVVGRLPCSAEAGFESSKSARRGESLLLVSDFVWDEFRSSTRTRPETGIPLSLRVVGVPRDNREGGCVFDNVGETDDTP